MTRGPATVARHPASGFAFANGGRAFRHRNYRLFFAGQLVSLVGTWMQAVAQAWLVLQLTHDPLVLGIVAALAFLPVLVLGLFGGLIADALPKRRTLMATQTVQMVLAFVLFVLVSTDPVQVWQVLVLAMLLGITNAVDMPTRQAFTVEVVGREDLGERGRPQLRDLQRRPDRRTGDRRPHDRVLRRRYQHRVPDQRDQLPRDHLRVCRDAGLELNSLPPISKPGSVAEVRTSVADGLRYVRRTRSSCSRR